GMSGSSIVIDTALPFTLRDLVAMITSSRGSCAMWSALFAESGSSDTTIAPQMMLVRDEVGSRCANLIRLRLDGKCRVSGETLRRPPKLLVNIGSWGGSPGANWSVAPNWMSLSLPAVAASSFVHVRNTGLAHVEVRTTDDLARASRRHRRSNFSA